jgi:ketosteroid isomerase-like protein
MVDELRAQEWLDGYSRAWETYDPTAIGDLFSEDAEYRSYPWAEGDEVVRGRQAIVDSWLKDPDKPNTYTGEYRPLLIQGDTVIAVGVSRYYTDASRKQLEREYHNLWIIEFDATGKCRSYTEWYMRSKPPRTAG